MQEVVSGVSKDVEEERLVQMAEFLRARAPKLAPNVGPGGHLKLAASNLMTICRTHKQRLEAESDIARRIKAKHDGEADEVGDGEDKEVALETELDFTNRTFRISGAKVRIPAKLCTVPISTIRAASEVIKPDQANPSFQMDSIKPITSTSFSCIH